VLDQDGGGGAPFATSLKILHRVCAKGLVKVLYSSYGIPSGPGELPLSFDPMAARTSWTVKGLAKACLVDSDTDGKYLWRGASSGRGEKSHSCL